MHEHGGEDRQVGRRVGRARAACGDLHLVAGVRDLVRDRRPVLQLADVVRVARVAEREPAALPEEVDEDVGHDQRVRDVRRPRSRDVVAQRQHRGVNGSRWCYRNSGYDGCRERADAGAVLLDVLVGVVRERTSGPAATCSKPSVVRRLLERGELLRRPVADDRQVALGRAQVLADGEDLDAGLAHLAERVDELVVRLAEADHQAGLGRDLALAHLERVARAPAASASSVEPRRATGYSRGATSRLWLKTSGRSAMTRASGISSPRKSGVRHSIFVSGACMRIERMTPHQTDEPRSGRSSRSTRGDHGVAQAHAGDASARRAAAPAGRSRSACRS